MVAQSWWAALTAPDDEGDAAAANLPTSQTDPPAELHLSDDPLFETWKATVTAKMPASLVLVATVLKLLHAVSLFVAVEPRQSGMPPAQVSGRHTVCCWSSLASGQ